MRVWWFCLLACAGFLGTGAAAAQDAPSRYGKSLVRSYELPAELLDQYNLVAHSQPEGRTETLAGIPAWTGTEFRTGTSGSPYTLVIKMLGAAIESEDVSARWQLDWGNARGVVPALGEPGAKKGELLQLVLASEAASLEDGRLVGPSLRLSDVRNLRMERVRVEVWSGVGETTWVDFLMDWWKLLATAAVWAGLYVYWRHDRRHDSHGVSPEATESPQGKTETAEEVEMADKPRAEK
ncbi:MAG: hypothetical protein V4454_18085 [Pseudomonadota bacterium]